MSAEAQFARTRRLMLFIATFIEALLLAVAVTSDQPLSADTVPVYLFGVVILWLLYKEYRVETRA